jgi:hypothetical protein
MTHEHPTHRDISQAPPRREKRSGLMLFLRYWLPGLICVSGIAYAATRGFDEFGIEVAVAAVAAGSSLWFMNVLLRVGFRGEAERDAEEEARQFLDRHGHWPDEPPPRRGS